MSKLELVTTAHGDFDKMTEWPRLMLEDAPSFDVMSFQKKIDAIVGVTLLGESIVRLRWARDCTKWVNIEWDSLGNATKGEFQQKYYAWRHDLGGGNYCDVSPPRWVLEERFEPAQYEPSWDESRYTSVPTGEIEPQCRYCKCFNWVDEQSESGTLLTCKICHEINLRSFVRRDMVGPAPREGWYNALYFIGVFNQEMKEKFGPWGGYRQPDEGDLRLLRKTIKARDADPECDPHGPLTPEAMKYAREWGKQKINEQRKAINERSN